MLKNKEISDEERVKLTELTKKASIGKQRILDDLQLLNRSFDLGLDQLTIMEALKSDAVPGWITEKSNPQEMARYSQLIRRETQKSTCQWLIDVLTDNSDERRAARILAAAHMMARGEAF